MEIIKVQRVSVAKGSAVTLENQTASCYACAICAALAAAAAVILPAKISMPCGDIFVCQAGCDVEHDNCTLPVDVVAITQAPKLFLTSCVPAVEAELPSVCGEIQRVHFYTNGGCRNSLSKTAES